MAQLRAVRGPGHGLSLQLDSRLARRARRRGHLRGQHVSARRTWSSHSASAIGASCVGVDGVSTSIRDPTPLATRCRSASGSDTRRPPREIAAEDIDVSPSGAGLPDGQRNAGAGRADLRGELRVVSRREGRGQGAVSAVDRWAAKACSTSRATTRFRARSATTGRTRRRSTTTSAERCR